MYTEESASPILSSRLPSLLAPLLTAETVVSDVGASSSQSRAKLRRSVVCSLVLGKLEHEATSSLPPIQVGHGSSAHANARRFHRKQSRQSLALSPFRLMFMRSTVALVRSSQQNAFAIFCWKTRSCATTACLWWTRRASQRRTSQSNCRCWTLLSTRILDTKKSPSLDLWALQGAHHVACGLRHI